MKHIPVYQIADFRFEEHDFYANKLSDHFKNHEFIETPHRHDFYFTLLCTKGTGTHEIDFTSYPVSAGSAFLMSPGQIHKVSLSDDADGYVMFHTGTFYETAFPHKQTDDYPIFSQLESSPMVQLNTAQLQSVTPVFERILTESQTNNNPLKWQFLVTLTDLLYLELSKTCLTKHPNITGNSHTYMEKLRQLRTLVDRKYKTTKSPREYAAMMNMTPKHLNRITNETLKKTTTTIIAERVVLEGKRLLVHSGKSVKEVADELGFDNPSYFIRFFKKHSGETPSTFVSRQRH